MLHIMHVSNVCFQVFQVFHAYVASVSSRCCKSRSGCCICCYGYTCMFQEHVSSVSSILRWYVAKIMIRHGRPSCLDRLLHTSHTRHPQRWVYAPRASPARVPLLAPACAEAGEACACAPILLTPSAGRGGLRHLSSLTGRP